MKICIEPKKIFFIVAMISVMCYIYLMVQNPIVNNTGSRILSIDNIADDKIYLPEIKFVKEIIRMLFNL